MPNVSGVIFGRLVKGRAAASKRVTNRGFYYAMGVPRRAWARRQGGRPGRAWRARGVSWITRLVSRRNLIIPLSFSRLLTALVSLACHARPVLSGYARARRR